MADGPPADPRAIATALRRTFPELGDVSVRRVLGSGFNSIAVETDSGLVFRVAKTAGTAERFAMEQRLLPELAPLLAPVAVPDPRWFAASTPDFPYGVGGYPKIEGCVLMPDLLDATNTRAIASQVAGILLAMHRFPVERARSLGLPGPEPRPSHYRSLREDTSLALRAHLTPDEYARVDRWWGAFLADERMRAFEPVLSQGDFWFANMLVDDGAYRLVGVVDWEHATVFDRALDFSTLLHLGEPFTAETIASYRAAGGTFDAADEHRMRRLWELREFYGVLYSVRFNDDAEMADSLRKLREGPILNA